MIPERVARLTLDFWRTGGPKTRERLVTLADHLAFQYQLDAVALCQMAEHAMWTWEREEMSR